MLTPCPEFFEESDREEGGEGRVPDVSSLPHHSSRRGPPTPGLPDVPEQPQM